MTARRTPRWPALAVSAAAALVTLVGIHALPFSEKGEAREALVVRAIFDGHGWVLPLRDGRDIPSKPPLFHWLAALAVEAGTRPLELAIRLPSVVLGSVSVGLTALLATQRAGPAAGVLAGVVLATTFEWMRTTSQSRVDMTLTCFLVAAVLAWHAALSGHGGVAMLRLGWLCAALAALAKGPVGVVLPVAIVGTDALLRGDLRALRRLADPLGLVVVGVLVVGWYAAAWQVGGAAFTSRQVLAENLQRFLGGDVVSHPQPFWYYPPAVAMGLMPWTLAWPALLALRGRERAPLDRFCLVWVVVVLVFYSVAAGKRAVYVLPLYPPLAVLTAVALVRTLARPPRPAIRLALRAGAVLLLVVALMAAVGAADGVVSLLRPLLHGDDRPALPLVIAVLRTEWPSVIVLVGGAGAALWVSSGRRHRLPAVIVAATCWALAVSFLGARPLAHAVTPRAAAERLAAALGPGDVVCARGYVDEAFRWYAKHPIPRCSVLRREGTTPTVRVQMLDEAGFAGRKRYAAVRVGGAPIVLEAD